MLKSRLAMLPLLTLALNGFAAKSITLIEPAPELSESSPWDLKQLSQPPEFRWLDSRSPIRSLLYTGDPYKGHPTEVFAYYATPGTLAGDPSKDKNLPAVVLIHGGGGTAFAEWVNLWAKRGYAAIAMDLAGKRLDPPSFDPKTGELAVIRNHRQIVRRPMENGGPDQGHDTKFNSISGPALDHWPYHAVANAIRAHSLIRSFPEVDQERTAVTGISWGGYTTCIVASLDNRFKAAVPVYGCGFLADGESVQRPAIEKLGPELAAKWKKLYDPSSSLPACRVPIFFVNGAKDIHYPLVSYSRSYKLIKHAPKLMRIEPNMRHSHPHGWAPKEIGLFIDSHCKGGDPLPEFDFPGYVDSLVEKSGIRIKSARPIQSAQFHFTLDDGLQSKRAWQSRPVAVENNRIIIADAPEGVVASLYSVTDDRGAMTSTLPLYPLKTPQ